MKNRKNTLAIAVAATLLAAPGATLAADAAQPPPPAKTADISVVKHVVRPTAFRVTDTTDGANRGQLTARIRWA